MRTFPGEIGRETHTLPHPTQRVAMATSPVKATSPPDDANIETKCTKCKKVYCKRSEYTGIQTNEHE